MKAADKERGQVAMNAYERARLIGGVFRCARQDIGALFAAPRQLVSFYNAVATTLHAEPTDMWTVIPTALEPLAEAA